MVKLGDVLIQPEPGWVRFDDRDPAIVYESGKWDIRTEPNNHKNGYTGAIKDKKARAWFDFVGNGLRLVALRAITYSDNIDIFIDGKHYGKLGTRGTDTRFCVIFAANRLPFGRHKVEIQVNATPRNVNTYDFRMDAIDIPEGGYLMHPDTERTRSLFVSDDNRYSSYLADEDVWIQLGLDVNINDYIERGVSDKHLARVNRDKLSTILNLKSDRPKIRTFRPSS